MTSARHFMTKTAVSAITLALGINAAAVAAPTSAVHRVFSNGRISAAAAVPTFTILHNFTGADGSAPQGNLDLGVHSTNSTTTRTLFGETEGGGSALSGSIYSYVLESNTFSSLYSFSGGNDGGTPVAGLANNESNYFSTGSNQIGVTIDGGPNGQGTVFVIGANGVPSLVHAFTGGADGSNPAGRVTQFTDGNYYGTTTGGALGFGTVYRITRSGVFSTIYSFTGNNDGGAPSAGLALRVDQSGHANIVRAGSMSATIDHLVKSSSQYVSPYLYGTTAAGGTSGNGTIFRITPAGKLQTVYNFTGGLDGAAPNAKLTSDLNGNLYGTASAGGSGGNGVVFEVSKANKFIVLHDFTDGTTGSNPSAQLTLGFNGNLYGVAAQGGASGQYGDIFKIASGGVFTDIHDFAGTDGSDPEGALVDGGDGKLYGATIAGGPSFSGVLFSITE